MSASVRISTCVDCATPIIGDRVRCPACHADNAAAIARSRGSSLGQILLAWVVFVEILAAVVFGLVLVVKGCTP